ncbi:hypothetical protein ACVWY3_001005 [Bradyrhizobium sp. USDA 4486]
MTPRGQFSMARDTGPARVSLFNHLIGATE